MAKKWYSIKAKGAGQKKVAQVRIYDEIGPWGKTANQSAKNWPRLLSAQAKLLCRSIVLVVMCLLQMQSLTS
ncbi:hypothetical protein C660_11742 [Alcaligenes sp. HPC1271]|nr:hypothetical protein C660_11742 [Alcaligenes sp. HPC1271]